MSDAVGDGPAGVENRGYYSVEADAARAYDVRARQLFTEQTLPDREAQGGFNFASRSSVFRGVSWHPPSNKWLVHIRDHRRWGAAGT